MWKGVEEEVTEFKFKIRRAQEMAYWLTLDLGGLLFESLPVFTTSFMHDNSSALIFAVGTAMLLVVEYQSKPRILNMMDEYKCRKMLTVSLPLSSLTQQVNTHLKIVH